MINATPRPPYPRERPGKPRGPRAGLDECGKSRPHRDSIPGPSISYRVAIPTELSRPTPTPAGPRFILHDSGQQNILHQPSDVIRSSLHHESPSDSLLSFPSAYCCYLPSIKIREDHRVWYSRAQTGSTDPHRVAGGTRVYTDDSV